MANKGKNRSKVRDVNGLVMGLVYYAIRIWYTFCGVRVKAVNKVGKLETPSIILCNHGSFVDFIYAAAFL